MIIKKVLIIEIITILSLSFISCATMAENPTANPSDVEEIQKQIDELKKENEQLKEEVSPAQNDEENVLEDSGTEDDYKEAEYAAENDTGIPSTWTDDMVIQINDPVVEDQIRTTVGCEIPNGDIRYGMIKDRKSMVIPSDLFQNQQPKNIESLKYFTGLESLTISVKELKDISVIEKMPSLERLTLYFADSNHLENLKNSNIKSLTLQYYQGDSIEKLNSIKSLETFCWNAPDDKMINNKYDLSVLKTFPNLKKMFIDTESVDWESLKELSNLEELYINIDGDRRYDKVDFNVDLGFISGLNSLKTFIVVTSQKDISKLKGLKNPKNIEWLHVIWPYDNENLYEYSYFNTDEDKYTFSGQFGIIGDEKSIPEDYTIVRVITDNKDRKHLLFNEYLSLEEFLDML